jgi:HAMP domain-containing protein
LSSDDPTLRALSELPRERASENFTTRVVARAGEAVEEPSRGWPRAAAAVAAALVLVSGLAAWQLERSRRLENIRGEVSELQSTHRLLEQELRELRAAEKPPVVYLGGDDKIDIYLDLAELERLQRSARRSSRSTVPQQTTGDTI